MSELTKQNREDIAEIDAVLTKAWGMRGGSFFAPRAQAALRRIEARLLRALYENRAPTDIPSNFDLVEALVTQKTDAIERIVHHLGERIQKLEVAPKEKPKEFTPVLRWVWDEVDGAKNPRKMAKLIRYCGRNALSKEVFIDIDGAEWDYAAEINPGEI